MRRAMLHANQRRAASAGVNVHTLIRNPQSPRWLGGSCRILDLRILAAASLWLSISGCSQDRWGPSLISGGEGPKPVPTAADRQLVWFVPGPHGFGEPTVGQDAVYFLALDHTIRAIAKSGGTPRWTTQLPIESGLFPGLASLVLGNQLIVADQDIFSLDASTGAIQWRFQPPVGRRPGYDAPVASDGVLYAGSVMGHLFAIDQRTGALRWVQPVGDSTDVAFRPVISNGVVYVGVTRRPPWPGQNGSRVVALDATTGAVRWTRDLPLIAARPATGTRAILALDGKIIAASGDGVVHALDMVTGQTRWTAARAEPPLDWGVPSPPDADGRGLATDGARIYVSSSTGLIVAISPADGSKLWACPVTSGALFDLRTDGRNVYALYLLGALAVLDATSGAVRWSYDGKVLPGLLDDRFDGTTAFDDVNLYVNGAKGFYAFKKE
jgi:outer membrane protein assembly factor BamB